MIIIQNPQTIILKVLKDPKIHPECIFQGERLDGLKELEEFQKSSENCNIFMVNEISYGQTIVNEYATKEDGYMFALILLNGKDMIPQNNLISKLNK